MSQLNMNINIYAKVVINYTNDHFVAIALFSIFS